MPSPWPTWKFAICDLDGRFISWIEHLMMNKQMKFILNRPSSLTFRVPSDHPQINLLHTDGYPYLECMRVIRGYRLETDTWNIRGCWYVWVLTDNSDNENIVYTDVSCFDPYQMLNKRLIIHSEYDGNTLPDVPIPDGTEFGDIIKTHFIERTNELVGETGIDTVNGTFATTDAISGVTIDQPFGYSKEYIGPNIANICDTGFCDVQFEPVDFVNGKHVVLSVFTGPDGATPIGAERDAAIFAFGMGPRTMQTYSRTRSVETMSNDVWVFGSEPGVNILDDADPELIFEHATVTSTQSQFLVHQTVDVNLDMPQAQVTEFATKSAAIRCRPRDVVSITPAPEFSATPWDEYFLGDSVRIFTDRYSREAIQDSVGSTTAFQRVYAITIDVLDNGHERVTELIASRDGS